VRPARESEMGVTVTGERRFTGITTQLKKDREVFARVREARDIAIAEKILFVTVSNSN